MPRKRLIVVILLVVGLLTTVGCGGDDDPDDVVGQRGCDADVSALDGSTTRLTYRGGAGLDRDVPVLCERLRGLKTSHRVRRAGRDRIIIEVPRERSTAAGAFDPKAVARVGRLSFYDWEANVIGPNGRRAPDDVSVTGGPAAGVTGTLSLYDAVRRASRREADVDEDNARRGSLFYAVDRVTKKVYGVGDRTRAAALASVPSDRRKRVGVLEVRDGTTVLRAAQDTGATSNSNQWFVLRDDVALPGEEIKNPRQRSDDGPGGAGAPIVTFEFTDRGRKIWRELTRTLAQRGIRAVRDLPGRDQASVNQHFAIVLDDAIVSVPFINSEEDPEGFDPRNGSQISGGFTIASARQLASVLGTGALPVPLQLISMIDREK